MDFDEGKKKKNTNLLGLPLGNDKNSSLRIWSDYYCTLAHDRSLNARLSINRVCEFLLHEDSCPKKNQSLTKGCSDKNIPAGIGEYLAILRLK